MIVIRKRNQTAEVWDGNWIWKDSFWSLLSRFLPFFFNAFSRLSHSISNSITHSFYWHCFTQWCFDFHLYLLFYLHCISIDIYFIFIYISYIFLTKLSAKLVNLGLIISANRTQWTPPFVRRPDLYCEILASDPIHVKILQTPHQNLRCIWIISSTSDTEPTRRLKVTLVATTAGMSHLIHQEPLSLEEVSAQWL